MRRTASRSPGRAPASGAGSLSGLERTRGLFYALVVLALVLLAAPTVVLTSPERGGAAVAVAALLGWSCQRAWRRGGSAWPVDALDTAGLVASALLAHQPTAVLGAAFGLVWFRSVYGSALRAALRVLLFAGAVSTGLVLWPHLHAPGAGVADVRAAFFALPTLAVNSLVMQRLATGLRASDAAASREATVAAAGADLLSATGPAELMSAARRALAALCEATPGLRLAVVLEQRGSEPGVVHRWGPAAAPGVLALDATGELELVGAPAAGGWCLLPLPQPADDERAWLLASAPEALLEQGMPAVRAVVHHVDLALRSVRARQVLHQQARTDPLTGLANRAAFHEALDAVTTAGSGAGAALLFIDLDGFKGVNDACGHLSGDEVLRTTAARLLSAVRPEDLCARLGGDEFAVLLPAVDPPAAVQVAQRLTRALGEPLELLAGPVRVGASVGVSHTAGVSSADALVRLADDAMYAAKALGTGQVRLRLEAPATAGAGAVEAPSLHAATVTGACGRQPPGAR